MCVKINVDWFIPIGKYLYDCTMYGISMQWKYYTLSFFLNLSDRSENFWHFFKTPVRPVRMKTFLEKHILEIIIPLWMYVWNKYTMKVHSKFFSLCRYNGDKRQLSKIMSIICLMRSGSGELEMANVGRSINKKKKLWSLMRETFVIQMSSEDYSYILKMRIFGLAIFLQERKLYWWFSEVWLSVRSSYKSHPKITVLSNEMSSPQSCLFSCHDQMCKLKKLV